MLKAVTEKRIRDATGMDAEIGKLSFGLLTPTVTLGDFKLYSPPDFGGTPFLNISELHAEYDLKALRKHAQREKLVLRREPFESRGN